jgi:hypothetical protein
MEAMLAILREVRNPRAFNTRNELGAMLFIALAATLSGQEKLRRDCRFRGCECG